MTIALAFSGVNFYSGSQMFLMPDGYRPDNTVPLAMLCKRSTGTSLVAFSAFVGQYGSIYQNFNSDGDATKWDGIIIGSWAVSQ